MAGMDWFRWHHGSVTDPKFQLVAKKAGASTAEVLAVWACLLEEASMAENRGNPGEIDFESIDCLLGMEDGKAQAIYARMNERGLLTDDGAIEAWERRQPKREREDSTNAERQRTFRAKKNQVTPDNASDSQKTPREEERRVEKKTPRKARGTSMPEGFEISERVWEWSQEKGFGQQGVAANFEAFISYVKRKGATYADWDEALMTAIRDDWAKVRGKPGGDDPYGLRAAV
jgi:hypothetical protein